VILLAVRRETIILELEDNASREALQAAAALKVLDKSINGLTGTAGRSRAFQTVSRDVDKMGTSFDRAGSSIDSFSGRLGVLTQAALVLGPALAPIGASLVPGIAAMATGMAGAAAAAASAGLAFAGVGDALGALNDVKLEPTAENFLKLQQAMDELGPAGANFVRFLGSLSGELEALQQIAGANMFPGMQQGLESLITLTPQAERLVADFSARLGNLAADSGAALAGPEWESFFSFLESDAAPIFEQFARATGNVALGLSNMMVAFAPLSRDFAAGMLEASRSFAAWSADSGNFTEFIDYVRRIGPQVSDFLGSLAEAAVALTQAVAPWGSVVLPALTTLLDLFTAVAGSPIGPALTTAALAMLAFNKAASAGTAIMGRVGPAFGTVGSSVGQMRKDLGTVATTWATAGAATERESKRMAAATGRLKGNLATVGKGAAVVGAIGVAASGAASGIGLQNTAMLGLAGTMMGPWGAAAGAGVGLILDFKASQDAAAAASQEFSGTLDQQTGALTANSTAWVASELSAGQIEKIRGLGLSIGDVSKAVAGGSDAWWKYYESLTATQKAGLADNESFFDLTQLLGDLDNLAKSADDGKVAFGAQKDALDAMGGSASGAAQSIQELEAAQRAQNQATLASIDAGTRWGQAIANARKQAAAGTKGFNHLTEAGRANRTAMSQLVGSYNAQSNAVKNSVGGYRKARAEVASVGKQMGLTRERIRQMQAALDKPSKVKVDGKQALQTAASIRERIGAIPKSTTATIRVDGSQAKSEVAAVQAVINSLQGKTVSVTTYQRTIYAAGKMDSIAKAQGKADGGEILGQRQPYGDKVLIWAAPGEEVISNRHGQADAFRRDRAAGVIPAYAEGGTISLPGIPAGYANGGTVRGAGTKSLERSLGRLEKAVDKHRSSLENWNSKRSEVRSEVSGSLQRDWFGGDSGSVWSGSAIAGTAAFAQQQWTKQRNDSKLLSKTIANLVKNGAGDAFIREILGSEDPLAAAQMFNKQSKAGMRKSQSLFLSASKATASAANYTSGVVYGDEQAKATRELRAANKKLSGIQKSLNKNHKESQTSRDKNGARKAVSAGSRARTRSKRG
jgi:hypothetical protein